ncbi:MAG: hypothetical protein Q9166_008221, partial [cf. Caloplaca sp. 2 TL-2023]
MLEDAVGKSMSVDEIAEMTGVEEGKLGEMRFAHVLRRGRRLKGDPSDHLPSYLLSPKGHSYKVEETAFQKAVGTKKPRWDWLEEKTTRENAGNVGNGYPGVPALEKLHFDGEGEDATIARPELETFGLAMTSSGKVYGMAHLYDYPWGDLGDAIVVDVGGGLGGFDIQLSHLYLDLKFVVQDRGPVVQQAETIFWAKEAPKALADFFAANPVKGAKIYWLRYI